MFRPFAEQLLSLTRILQMTATMLALCAFSAFPVIAQPMMPAGGPAGPRPLTPNKVLDTVGVDQLLDAQVPGDLTFKDETGKTVRLQDYYGKRPILISLVYYECPGLCTMTLNGVARSLRMLAFTPSKEFEVLTISFDPRETPELAARKKKTYLKEYLQPGLVNHNAADAEGGWHFLTSDEANIAALTKAVGFRYAYDEKTKQYAHASAIMLLTPQGKVSRYFYGLEYSTKDIRLGIIEAAENRIGTLSDAIQLMCYAYDPSSAKYSLAILKVMRIGAVLTVLSLGTFMFVMFRRERRNKLQAPK
jgi:protein SCO1